MPTIHANETRRAVRLTGSLFVALAAFGFSAKAILVKLAYFHQVDSVTLLALRMAFAFPFFLLMGLWGSPVPGQDKLSRADAAAVAGLGLLGYYLASFLDFWGLEFISAGIERLILFLYPTLVLVFSFFFLGRPIKAREILALVLSYAGVGLVFYRQTSVGQADMLIGASLVFGSTVAYAVYLMGSHRVIQKMGPRRFTAYGMSAACVACLVQFAITHPGVGASGSRAGLCARVGHGGILNRDAITAPIHGNPKDWRKPGIAYQQHRPGRHPCIGLHRSRGSDGCESVVGFDAGFDRGTRGQPWKK